MQPNVEQEEVLLVYDGECPLCRAGASNFCVNENVEGRLNRINKRAVDEHPVLEEIRQHQLNLDRGMVLKYRGQLYQGAEALHAMSRIGTGNNWATRCSKILFRYRFMAYACYPFLRFARNSLIWFKGVGPINNLGER
jgi:predicted DCC family thiol-disulfide oxidoreductase YuxK